MSIRNNIHLAESRHKVRRQRVNLKVEEREQLRRERDMKWKEGSLTMTPQFDKQLLPLAPEGRCDESFSTTPGRKGASVYHLRQRKNLTPSPKVTSSIIPSLEEEQIPSKSKERTVTIQDTTAAVRHDNPEFSGCSLYRSETGKIRALYRRAVESARMQGKGPHDVGKLLPIPNPKLYTSLSSIKKWQRDVNAKLAKLRDEKAKLAELEKVEEEYKQRKAQYEFQVHAYKIYRETLTDESVKECVTTTTDDENDGDTIHPSSPRKSRGPVFGRVATNVGTRYQHFCPLYYCLGIFLDPTKHLNKMHKTQLDTPELKATYLSLCEKAKREKFEYVQTLPPKLMAVEIRVGRNRPAVEVGIRNLQFLRSALKKRKRTKKTLAEAEAASTTESSDETDGGESPEGEMWHKSGKGVVRSRNTGQSNSIIIRRCPTCQKDITHVATHLTRKHSHLSERDRQQLRISIFKTYVGRQEVSFRGDSQRRKTQKVESKTRQEELFPYSKSSFENRLAKFGTSFQFLVNSFFSHIKRSEKNWMQTLSLIKKLFMQLDSDTWVERTGRAKRFLSLTTTKTLYKLFSEKKDESSDDDEQSSEDDEQSLDDDEQSLDDDEQSLDDDEQSLDDDEQSSDDDEQSSDDEAPCRLPSSDNEAPSRLPSSDNEAPCRLPYFNQRHNYKVESMKKAVRSMLKFVDYCLTKTEISTELLSLEEWTAMSLGIINNQNILTKKIHTLQAKNLIRPSTHLRTLLPMQKLISLSHADRLRTLLKKASEVPEGAECLSCIGGRTAANMIRNGFMTILTLSTFRPSQPILEITNHDILSAIEDFLRNRGTDRDCDYMFITIPGPKTVANSGQVCGYVLDESLVLPLRDYIHNIRPFFKEPNATDVLLPEGKAFPNQRGNVMTYSGLNKSMQEIWAYVYGPEDKYCNFVTPMAARKSLITSVNKETPEFVPSLARLIGCKLQASSTPCDPKKEFTTISHILDHFRRRYCTAPVSKEDGQAAPLSTTATSSTTLRRPNRSTRATSSSSEQRPEAETSTASTTARDSQVRSNNEKEQPALHKFVTVGGDVAHGASSVSPEVERGKLPSLLKRNREMKDVENTSDRKRLAADTLPKESKEDDHIHNFTKISPFSRNLPIVVLRKCDEMEEERQ